MSILNENMFPRHARLSQSHFWQKISRGIILCMTIENQDFLRSSKYLTTFFLFPSFNMLTENGQSKVHSIGLCTFCFNLFSLAIERDLNLRLQHHLMRQCQEFLDISDIFPTPLNKLDIIIFSKVTIF